MENLNDEEKKIVEQALDDYVKKLDKLMAQCIKSKQHTAAEKVLSSIRLTTNLRDLIK